jgi:hypothetical protein
MTVILGRPGLDSFVTYIQDDLAVRLRITKLPMRFQTLASCSLLLVIRNTRAVRTWSGQQMRVFSKADLSDADLDAVAACLYAMAKATR